MILHPYDMLPSSLKVPTAVDPMAVGLFFRMLPYMLHPRTLDPKAFASFANVSPRTMRKWWPVIDAAFFARDDHGNVVLAPSEWLVVQTVTAERQSLRHLLDRLVAYWGSACVYCGEESGELHIEHIVPIVRGGSDDLTNLTLACPGCNLTKRTKTAEEFGFPHIQEMARRIQ